MLGLIGPIVDGAKVLGKQWLDNKGAKAQAKADLEIAKLKARTQFAQTEVEAEIGQLQHANAMDLMQQKANVNSYIDEIFSLLIMFPGGLACYGAVSGLPPAEWGLAIFQALEEAPIWWQAAMGLIFINYLGFRTLARLALKHWMAKGGGFGINFGSNSPIKRQGNHEQGQG